jgi:two-component system CheB/CheR fusion protein
LPSAELPGGTSVDIPKDAVPGYRNLHLQLLAQHAPTSVLINERHAIVHLSKRDPRLFHVPTGHPSHTLLDVIHPALHSELMIALAQASRQGVTVETRDVSVHLGDELRSLRMLIQPLHHPKWAEGYMLVVFNDLGAGKPHNGPTDTIDSESNLRRLEEELIHTRAQLHQFVEEYDHSTEELKVVNEELHATISDLQATNEELQAAQEELQTSREEIQFANDELLAINQRLERQMADAIAAHNDLQNLMAATEIATLFLDRQLRITRFTPCAQALFNLIPADLNRPLTHITHQMRYEQLFDDVAHVLANGEPIEREVQNHDRRWYLARLRPYRTDNDAANGIVLTFVDITERKQIEQERESLLMEHQRHREFLEQLVAVVPTPIAILHGPEHRYTLVNSAYRNLGRGKGEIIGRTVAEIWPELAEDVIPLLDRVYMTGRSHHAVNQPWFIRRGDELVEEFYTFSYVRLTQGQPEGVLVTAYDTTEHVRAQQIIEAQVQERTHELHRLNEALHAEAVRRTQLEEARTELLRALVTAQEEERRRISRELHDQMGQSLSALRLGLALFGDAPPPAEEVARLQRIAAQIDEDMDRLALELRPSALDDLGLKTALQQHVEEWAALTGIDAEFQSTGIDHEGVPAEVAIVLYRVAQEALTNVLKHADARHVSVILERRPEQVRLIVEDDGQGFDVDAIQQGPEHRRKLGLLGMQERVAFIDGACTIESEPGHGTTVFVRIPLVQHVQEGAPDA